MDRIEIKSIIEALLFTWGDPLEIEDIGSIIEIDKDLTLEIVLEMIDDFERQNRGIRIIRINNSFQMSTRPDHHTYISKLTSPRYSKNLSNAALETLSIIAYRQPIIKAEIDAIRGVRSDKSLDTLIQRGLVEEVGRLEKIGRPILYGTTNSFLRAFGLEEIDDLPRLEEVNEDQITMFDLEEDLED